MLYGNSFYWFSVSWRNKCEFEEISGIKIIRQRNNYIAHLQTRSLIAKYELDFIIDDMGHAIPWFNEGFKRLPGAVMFYHLHRRSLSGQVSFPVRLFITLIETLYPFFYRNWPFVTESHSSATDLMKLGIKMTRINIISLGVNEIFYGRELKSEKPQLVYFGGMRDYKRPWDALYVLHKLMKHFPEITLIIVGSGPSIYKVKKLCKKLGLESHVTFAGRLKHDLLRVVVENGIGVSMEIPARAKMHSHHIIRAYVRRKLSISHSGVSKDKGEYAESLPRIIQIKITDVSEIHLSSLLQICFESLHNRKPAVSPDQSAVILEDRVTAVVFLCPNLFQNAHSREIISVYELPDPISIANKLGYPVLWMVLYDL